MTETQTATEYFLNTLGRVVLVFAVLFEIYFLIPFQFVEFIGKLLRRPGTWYSSLQTILRDYRSGKFYKPWNSGQKVVIVSSKKHIVELSEAAELSQRAVYADMFGFKHTMSGLDHTAHIVARSRLYGRLLQVSGPGNLAALYPLLKKRLEKSLEKQLQLAEPIANGYISVPVASTVRELASKLMGLIFFGESISSDPKFAAALLRYPKDMVANMAAFQITPSFLSSTVHYLITNGGAAMRIILDQVRSTMSIGNNAWNEEENIKKFTIMHNMMDLSEERRDYWTPEVMSQSLLGIWFAASHQPWMNLDFVMLELCARPEYAKLLRDEIGDFSQIDYAQLENLPFLDSFIKETVRLNPLDTLAIRRKALKPFNFTEGPKLTPGSIACVSSFDLMHNEDNYPHPYEFDGRRFVSCDSTMRGTKFSDVSEKFPVWGYGSLACPGRFHASLVMKLSVAYLVSNFDMRLEEEKAPVRWMWETFTMPYEKTRMLLKRVS